MIALLTIRQRHSKGISVRWCVTPRKDGCAAALCISAVGMQKLSLQGRIWAIWMQMHSLKDHWCAARGLLTPAVDTQPSRGKKRFGVKLCRVELVLH